MVQFILQFVDINTRSIKYISPLFICPLLYTLEKDISNFVDLASSTLGEDDLAVYKTRSLLNALTGYSPLIYHLKRNMGYEQFFDLCSSVWKSLKENKELVKNLVTTYRIFSCNIFSYS